MSLPHTLLIVDDDKTLRLRMARAFEDRGWAVATAADVEEAKHKALRGPPEFALVDLRIGDRSGLELVSALKAINPSTTVVILTGYGSIANAVEAVRLGASHYLSKPADADDVIAAFTRDGHLAPEPQLEPGPLPTLARAEWEHISRALSDCGGNVSHAAVQLRVHRRTLQRKLKRPAPQE